MLTSWQASAVHASLTSLALDIANVVLQNVFRLSLLWLEFPAMTWMIWTRKPLSNLYFGHQVILPSSAKLVVCTWMVQVVPVTLATLTHHMVAKEVLKNTRHLGVTPVWKAAVRRFQKSSFQADKESKSCSMLSRHLSDTQLKLISMSSVHVLRKNCCCNTGPRARLLWKQFCNCFHNRQQFNDNWSAVLLGITLQAPREIFSCTLNGTWRSPY